MTKSGFQRAVLSANVAVLALTALAIGKWMGVPAAVAALVGNLLGVLNLLGLTWLVGKLLDTAERGGTSKAVYASILAFKLVAFVGVMALCVKVFELDVLGPSWLAACTAPSRYRQSRRTTLSRVGSRAPSLRGETARPTCADLELRSSGGVNVEP